MEFKGTPGKWFTSHRKSEESDMYSTEVYCVNGNTIATIHWYKKPPVKMSIDGSLKLVTGTYREANALLISKAPEMLENLHELTQILNGYIQEQANNNCFPNDIIQKVLKAEQLIKEATELKSEQPCK